MEIKTFLLIVLALFILFSCARFYHEYMTAKGTVDELGKKNTELANAIGSLIERMSKLEESSRKRMPREAMDQILDGLAALDVRERAVDFEKDVLENARAHFAKALAVGTKREEK